MTTPNDIGPPSVASLGSRMVGPASVERLGATTVTDVGGAGPTYTMPYVMRKMPNEMPWYAWFSLAVIIPASFFGSAWLLHWAIGADPLADEIWRLRGQNSVLRERLEQLEGERRRDADTLRKVIGK